MWVSDGGGRGGVQWWAALRSPARLAQLLQPSLAFCFRLQPMTASMTAYRPGLKQNANEGCNSCATGV